MSLEFDIFFLVRVPELKLKLTEEVLSVHEIFERYFSRDEACCFREFGYFCFEQFSSTPDTSFTLQLSVVPARGSHSKPRLLAPSVKLPQQISSHFRDKFLRDTFSLGFLFTVVCDFQNKQHFWLSRFFFPFGNFSDFILPGQDALEEAACHASRPNNRETSAVIIHRGRRQYEKFRRRSCNSSKDLLFLREETWHDESGKQLPSR